jgi:hypothetical protein
MSRRRRGPKYNIIHVLLAISIIVIAVQYASQR